MRPGMVRYLHNLKNSKCINMRIVSHVNKKWTSHLPVLFIGNLTCQFLSIFSDINLQEENHISSKKKKTY